MPRMSVASLARVQRSSLVTGTVSLMAASSVLMLAACDRDAGNSAPPRVRTPAALPQQSSTIVVPISGSLASIATTLDRELPRSLWKIDERKPACVAAKRVDIGIAKLKLVPRMSCRIVGAVTRGRPRLSGHGDTLLIDLPVRAAISAKDVGGIVNGTATGEAMVHAIAHLSIDRRWTPTARIELRYDWTTPPGVDLLGQRIEFAKMADARLRPVVADLERTLPRELAKLNLRKQLDSAWAKGFTTVSLNRDNPPVWMRLTPRRLGFGGYRVSGGRLELLISADALTQTFVGDRPAAPQPTALPPPSKAIGSKGINVFVPVLADYRQLEPVIERALRKLAARGINVPEIGAIDAKFGTVTVYATTNNQIAIGVKASVHKRGSATFATSGQVWLIANPYNDLDSQIIRARNIRIVGQTNSTVANLLLKVFGESGVQEGIREALTQNLGKDYANLLADVRREIGERREGDFILSSHISEVHNGRIKATGEGLFLPVSVKGEAKITFRPQATSSGGGAVRHEWRRAASRTRAK